ncbi:uncharacterized protein LOC142628728 [Castanea sativa]|uniref:uncharacterized protein LOC142628728 n=1 Tax=Castanea sativa TaxID=21020 RepID=UPI003F64FD81
MDKSWMDAKRGSEEYFHGLNSFVEFAACTTCQGKISCPCRNCRHRHMLDVEVVRDHLYSFGMVKNYRTWVFNGEFESTQTTTEGGSSCVHETLDQYGDFHGMLHDLHPMHDMASASMDEGPSMQQGPDGPSVQQPVEAIVVLYHLKTLCGWTNKSFTLLLQVLQDLLPSDAKFPKDCYEAKKIITDLGLGYEKIHACPNDCMLYWKEKSNLDACPHCEESRWKPPESPVVDKTKASSSKIKKKAAKVLHWFPLKPRLQRLFLSSELATNMKWHATGRTNDGVMRHPADFEVWKEFDDKHVEFASDPRNVRLGLAADGFNPYGNMSTTHSTCPVVLVPYNLPPWMCMKRSSLILSLVIPGPTSPVIAIDVYLQPLVEELRELWDVGVESFDASSNTRFQLHAALMWTINDFPAYADISGWSMKGLLACPCCMNDTESCYLKHGRKVCYMGHRRWLDNDLEFREDDINFDGTKEFRVAPVTPSGSEIMDQTKKLVGRCLGKKHQALYNKRKRGEEDPCVWKKRSILFTLPYWADQKLRYNIDVMHTEKNVTDNIMATLLDLKDKTKDTYQARLDLKAMGIRSELHLVHKAVDTVEMPAACYNMSTSEKDGFLQVLKDVKVPDGYASNISRRVHLKERKISGLKSHDDHILMQQLLPIALRGSLPSQVTSELEKIFPPSFFTVMVHVVMHLAREAKLGGPVHYRWMYPIER